MSKTSPQLRQCSLCGNMRHTVVEVPLDDHVFLFCNIAEARVGIFNYNQNKKKGLTHSAKPTIDAPEVVERNA